MIRVCFKEEMSKRNTKIKRWSNSNTYVIENGVKTRVSALEVSGSIPR